MGKSILREEQQAGGAGFRPVTSALRHISAVGIHRSSLACAIRTSSFEFLLRLAAISVISALFLLCALGAAADAVKVINAKPDLAQKYFDPKNKPKEMPELHGSEQAVCQSRFGIASEFQVAIVDEHRGLTSAVSKVRVASVIVRLSLQTTEWLPNGAREDVKAHEAAHSQIAQTHYKDAQDKARDLSQKYIDQTLTGEGATIEAARRDAIAKANQELCSAYLTAVERPSARVNDLFDEITNHGRKNIEIDEAIRQAFERYAKEKDR